MPIRLISQYRLKRKRRTAHCLPEHSQVDNVVTLFFGESRLQQTIHEGGYTRLNHCYPVRVGTGGSVTAKGVHKQTRYLD